MRPPRLVVLAGLGALAAATPALACVPGPDAGRRTPDSDTALALLDSATATARDRAWHAVQEVTSWQGGRARTAVLDVQHEPGSGSVVTDPHDPSRAVVTVPSGVLDDRLLGLLVSGYALALEGTQLCAGHPAEVVAARRRVDGTVAGRFWVDQRTGLVLRRDVLDETGRVLRRSAVVRLDLSSGPAAAYPEVARALRPSGRRVMGSELDRLRAPSVLPGGMQLFDARMHDERVLQLAYSDGLSTMSVFVQPGTPPQVPAARTLRRGGATVAVVGSAPERLVWSGAGRTWTLVSEAPASAVDAAVAALPHEGPVRARDHLLARVWRGLSRVGAWLNPFD